MITETTTIEIEVRYQDATDWAYRVGLDKPLMITTLANAVLDAHMRPTRWDTWLVDQLREQISFACQATNEPHEAADVTRVRIADAEAVRTGTGWDV